MLLKVSSEAVASKKAVLRGGVAALALLWGHSAFAQQRAFNLDAGDLVKAIPQFAQQAGVQIVAPAGITGIRTPALRGTYDVRAALDSLLQRTNLEVISDDGRVIVLRVRQQHADSSAVMKVAAETSAAPMQAAQVAPAAPAPAQNAQAPALEEIVVTGSRVVRDGYEAPTPLTVVGVEQIQAAGPSNIADFVNQLPTLAGSQTPGNSQKSSSAGNAGVNTLNLRALGSTRTLVLLDGQRSVPTTVNGLVDINNFPQDLVSRVDIVTGGASAAYGSDALSGVVNFVLNTTFTGVKGEVSGGVTTYGDDRNWKVALTAGTPFAGGRGHFLFSGELSNLDGVLYTTRDWNMQGWKIFNNPAYTATNGLPRLIIRNHTGLSTASQGGIITNTALRGIDFGPGGVPRQYNYGVLTSDPFQVEGDWKSTNTDFNASLDGKMNHQSAFTRASYDLTDDLNVFVQGQWGYSFVHNVNAQQYNVANVIISSGNPFIPASVQAQMTALKITQFTLGTMNADLERIQQLNGRTVLRFVAGAKGKVDAFDNAWNWDAYFQKGVSRASENLTTTRRSNYTNAVDAVRAPSGAIVCRSTLTSPSNGCVPYNVMGVGVNSEAALNYIRYKAHRNQRFSEDVAAATARGEPFSNWAGQVSLALGIEHRREAVSGASTDVDRSLDLFVGNFLPNAGSYTVTEGFVETVFPLAKDTVWARSLDLNAAMRGTGYSVSGYVTTWKLGLTYNPIDDIRFRATRSRDIRAPNLGELYQAGSTTVNFLRDPFNNNNTIQSYQTVSGNLGLVPEKADTLGLGVVIQPQFFPGFSASADYYNIKIGGAIGSYGAQTILDLCYAGQQIYCDAITRGSIGGVAAITAMRIQPFNFVTQKAQGLDLEASYRTRLDAFSSDWNGDVILRALATRYIENYQFSGVPTDDPTDSVGGNAGSGPPKWRYMFSATYSNDPIVLNVTGRGISAGLLNTSWIQCTSGCPASTTNHMTVENNFAPGAFYWDMALTYKFMHGDSGTAEAFFNVKNIANTDPAMIPWGNSGTDYNRGPSNPSLYDVLGRVFRAGIRFTM